MQKLSAEYVRSILEYDPVTGVFRWKWRVSLSPAWSVRWAGRAAGFTVRGHTQIQIGGSNFYAHRLAWLHVHGEWPPEQVDHINGDRSDNRLANLRLANNSENGCNKSMQRNNTSGAVGVTFHPQTGKWRARINKNGQKKFDGLFDTKDAAVAARGAALRDIHGAFSKLG